ncbi:MAG TPA: HAD family hydrolase [Candidatus Nanopelagicales bacterium]|nr:HAD family hydrolase [Candidatus Nanopelagicales bacterium]
MSVPSALILDLDRTLIDLQSFTDYQAALADVQSLVGDWADVDVPVTDWDRATFSCMAVLHVFLEDPRWQAISEAIAVHERAAISQSHLMPTVADCTSVFCAIPTAVVTLLPTDVAIAVLDFHNLDLGREIDVVIGRNPRIRPKPEPDGVLEACRRLAVPPDEAVMIGDSTWDAEAALAAGASFVGVPPDGFGAEFTSRIEVALTMRKALQSLGTV